MEQIIITHPDGSKTPLVSKQNVSAVTKAEQTVGLLADDIVNISVQSATAMQFALGDTIEVYGKTYTLNQLPTIKKNGERKFNYDLVFEGVQYELLDAQFLLPDNTVGDSFTGNLFAFLQILISNANRVFPGKWTRGEYPAETEYKTLTFTGDNCLSVLQRLCEEYQQEFEIEQTSNGIRVLNIQKAGDSFPFTFRYGRTGGLYELNRQNINSKNVVTRLFVYGGSNNVQNNYLTARGSNKLCLPGKNKNTSYIQEDEPVINYGIKENTKNFDTIFPNRYGKVTAKGSKYYAFIDNTMDFDLNAKDGQGNTLWLIAGVPAKVHFNTGNLAGYEFDVHKYDHETKTIELVPFTDENGMKFPSETSAAFQFAPEDKYFFIDINLPQSYITEAESKLIEAGEEYYAQNSQPQVQYGLTIDENFIKQFTGNLNVVNLFAVGDYIPVQDTDIGVDKSVRITGFTRDLLKPYKYAITLGDAVTKSAYVRMIAEQNETGRIIEINNLANPANARRNWRASQEVLSMVFDTEGDYYSEKIKPLSIETTMLQVGAKSMQFVLQNVLFEPNYEGNPNYIRISGGNLIHYTIEETIRNWTMRSSEFSQLVSDTAYYIYARCQQSGTAGSIILDTTQRKVNHEAGYYTFMVGVLNSVQTYGGGLRPARLVSLTYGSTTINGRFIKTGRIESSGGSGSFFDLDYNKFKIGGIVNGRETGLSWNEDDKGQLVLRGTMVQSQAGVTEPIGVFRGAYNSTYTYYQGDEVTYNGSTYRYINNAPGSGIVPTNTTYWIIIASKGNDGTNGNNGTNGKDGTNGADGDKGDKGDKGDSPALVFRGEYNPSTSILYYGTSNRVDVVRYNGYYYVAQINAGDGFNVVPTNTTKWNGFGAQFDSVATNLLLAELANIAGWIFRNQRLESQSGNVFLDGVNGKASFANGKILLNKDGSGQLANGNVVWDDLGNVTYRGKFETSASGRRVVIDNANANITIYNVAGDEILKITFDNAITGNHEFAKILMKTKVGPDGDEWNTILSPLQLTLYRKLANGTSDTSFTAFQGGGVMIKNLPIARPPAGQQSVGMLWRDGETLKVGI